MIPEILRAYDGSGGGLAALQTKVADHIRKNGGHVVGAPFYCASTLEWCWAVQGPEIPAGQISLKEPERKHGKR